MRHTNYLERATCPAANVGRLPVLAQAGQLPQTNACLTKVANQLGVLAA